IYSAIDSSYQGFEATLNQKDNKEKEHPIVYTSKSLRKEEQNYAATKLEYADII
ncbi:3213_t:CDS:1, partial [Racocetra fulgida]